MIKKIKELCGPIQLLLILYLLGYSIFFYIWIFGEDNENNKNFIKDVENYYQWDILIFIVWITILYYLCKNNYKTTAWLVVIIPLFIQLLFVFIVIFFMSGIQYVLLIDDNEIQKKNIWNNLGRLCYFNCETCDGPSLSDCTSCKDGSQVIDEDNDGAGYC
tara:strand:- start:75 stop:557 length:483 start_codon:yes stop_codon:yes gene_type:complete